MICELSSCVPNNMRDDTFAFPFIIIIICCAIACHGSWHGAATMAHPIVNFVGALNDGSTETLSHFVNAPQMKFAPQNGIVACMNDKLHDNNSWHYSV